MKKILKLSTGLTILILLGCSDNTSSSYNDENSNDLGTDNVQSEMFSEDQELDLVTPEANEEEVLPSVPRPMSGLYSQNLNQQQAIAPLEIQSQPGSDYFVKVTNQSTGEDVSTIYIRGGENASITVPLGTYEIKYASGENWYGEDKLFGKDTTYSKADELFTFSDTGYQITGYTITLYTVVDGNLQTVGIDPSQF